MANHIVNRTVIITSAVTATEPILGVGSASWANDQAINSMRFWGADTTSKFELVYASDTSKSFWLSTPVSQSISPDSEQLHFSYPQYVSELRVKTLVAGTAWIYLA